MGIYFYKNRCPFFCSINSVGRKKSVGGEENIFSSGRKYIFLATPGIWGWNRGCKILFTSNEKL